ncbi:hypothetical protein ABT061_33080 [Streptosporangium sp. NPDC002544]|uniref:hypothetical protein n=1 Tax=Streptosporangium sp. NPDC002544 TaxID=3154538 RepID=UPI0033279F91
MLFAPVTHVIGTGLLMCLIGLRFGQAARASRPSCPGPLARPPLPGPVVRPSCTSGIRASG